MIAVRQPDGTFKATTIKARFGGLKIINPNEKEVEIYVNNIKSNFKLRLSQSGEVYHAEQFKKIVSKNQANSIDENSSTISLATQENISNAESPDINKRDKKLSPKEALIEEFNLNKIQENNSQISPIKTNSMSQSKINQKQMIVFDDNDLKLKTTDSINNTNNNECENISTNFNNNYSCDNLSYKVNNKNNFKSNIKNDNVNSTHNIIDNKCKESIKSTNKNFKLNLCDIDSFQNEKDNSQAVTPVNVNNINKNNTNSCKSIKSKDVDSKYNISISDQKTLDNNIKCNSEDNLVVINSSSNLLDTYDNYIDLNYKVTTPKYTTKNSIPNKIRSNTFSLIKTNNQYLLDNNNKQSNINGIENNVENKLTLTNQESFCIDRSENKTIIDISNCWSSTQINKVTNLEEEFFNNLISFEEFQKDPWAVINNKNTAFRIQENLYNWKAAGPILLSKLLYNKDLPDSCINNLLVEEKAGFFNKIFGYNYTNKNIFKLDPTKSNSTPLRKYSTDSGYIDKQSSKFHNLNVVSSNSNTNIKNTESLTHIDNNIKNLNTINNNNNITNVSNNETTPSSVEVKTYYKKVFELSSDQLKELNLKEGRNEISFVVQSRLQGKQILNCELFLWNYDSKIVISDIDGTITRSDFLGHVLPLFGRDWTHRGIVYLFNSVYENGYKILYLSARSLSQATSTKAYLRTIIQDNSSLPDGPVMLSPDSIMKSLKREVIDKTPEVFKIACLMEIANLFPVDEFPFYAGFGNRITVINYIIFYIHVYTCYYNNLG